MRKLFERFGSNLRVTRDAFGEIAPQQGDAYRACAPRRRWMPKRASGVSASCLERDHLFEDAGIDPAPARSAPRRRSLIGRMQSNETAFRTASRLRRTCSDTAGLRARQPRRLHHNANETRLKSHSKSLKSPGRIMEPLYCREVVSFRRGGVRGAVARIAPALGVRPRVSAFWVGPFAGFFAFSAVLIS